MKYKLIFFDFETNGFKGSSVLSIAAVKAQYDSNLDKFEKIGELHRYYYRDPGEKENLGALKVNGLYDEVIRKNRGKETYAKHYNEDKQAVIDFFNDADCGIAHNINFDKDFLPLKLRNEFCTMQNNIDIVKAGVSLKTNSWKWPSLLECAKFYKVPFEKDKLHNSLYDVLITFRVFFRMTKNKEARDRIFQFLNKIEKALF